MRSGQDVSSEGLGQFVAKMAELRGVAKQGECWTEEGSGKGRGFGVVRRIFIRGGKGS
jgi:hypothetical protein